MFVGFAVLATVTAQISSAFIEQAARARAEQSPATNPAGDDATLRTIADQLSRIEAQLGGPPST
jgi:hypothetical protein